MMQQPQLNHKKIRQDLLEALSKQPFPIRGWHLSLKLAATSKYLYPVHKLGEIVRDDDGIPVSKPEILFQVPTKELTLTADFRLEACKELAGMKFVCPQQCIDQQWIRFANTNGSMEIILDTKKIPPYLEQLYYPDKEEWQSLVDHWAKAWNVSKRKDPAARWVLTQLQGIRDSGNHMLQQSLLRLVSRIEKEVPDYWMWAEIAMAGKLGDEEIRLLNEMEVSALTIRTFQRPQGAPTETIQ